MRAVPQQFWGDAEMREWGEHTIEKPLYGLLRDEQALPQLHDGQPLALSDDLRQREQERLCDVLEQPLHDVSQEQQPYRDE